MAEKVNYEKVLPPGMKRHKCTRCKGPHLSYYNYPTICNDSIYNNNCFEKGLVGQRR